ncbi:hypothetical protein F5I97DRAFT_1877220 [Phlebopus sp. FC_14]|nr:hypothetical protein F5I97DRAFT_1877220 [Phlebopus sp. FC_14]
MIPGRFASLCMLRYYGLFAILLAIVSLLFSDQLSAIRRSGPTSREEDALSNTSGLVLPLRTLPATFLKDNANSSLRVRATRLLTSHRIPDVTAIVLNWSRLHNVIRIASLLCEPWLDDTVAEVLIWNNSPHKLSYETFMHARCSKQKLKIYNSPENLYFQARFLACMQASTPFCFVQDDDYIVLPEIIQTLRIRIEGSLQTAIHLLPPHEHLSSRLRTTITAGGIHTGFAWLGHGTMLPRHQALSFMSLLSHLNFSEPEIKMADNYFTILSNQIPEIWFDQGIELGGGQPFTVGKEGDDRNRGHITNGCRYLEQVVTQISDPLGSAALDFVKTSRNLDQWSITRAACFGTPCLLETNIRLLPDDVVLECDTAADMLALEDRNMRLMGHDAIAHYIQHALSFAIDGDPSTAFGSRSNARQGDFILIDMLAMPGEEAWSEVAFLIPSENEPMLEQSIFESSQDGRHWRSSSHPVVCGNTDLAVGGTLSECQGSLLIECSVQMPQNDTSFRVTLTTDMPMAWTVFEVWVRTVSNEL